MKRGIVVGMLALCMLLGAGVAGVYITGDRQGPKITTPDDSNMTYVEGTDTKYLLEGIEAVDKKDGDVSDSLVIENIRPNEDKTQVAVIYVAKDSKNNVTKKTRIMNYQTEGAEPVKSDEDSQQDPKIEDSNQPDPAMDSEGEGTNTENESRPVNGTAEGEAVNEAAIAALPAGSPKFYLTEYDLTITAGSTFNELSYVKEITDDKDTRERLYRNIQIEGQVNSGTAGTYEMRYHVVDSDGNKSNDAVLKVTIQ